MNVPKSYRVFVHVVFHATVLLVLLNIVASHCGPRRIAERDLFVADDDRPRPPPFSSHPRLEFRTRPTNDGVYNVGLENMRYTGWVTATTAAAAIDGGVWVFGGSTVFGSGVGDHETIPHALGALDRDHAYVNFGAVAYTQRLEITKLLHLLEKGYRPKRVVFVDGLNDMLAALASPFAATDTPARVPSAYAFDFGVHRFQRFPTRLFWQATPLVRWLEQDLEPGSRDLDNPDALFVTDPWRHYFARPRQFDDAPGHVEGAAKRAVEAHRANLDLIAGLAAGFGFEADVFFQPNGLTRTSNRFLRDPTTYPDTMVYRASVALTEAVRAAITDGRLAPMIDISDTHDPDAYVDAVHYSRPMAEALARRILVELSRARSL